jgi:predicted patatin/cPLA2 family phospholipase
MAQNHTTVQPTELIQSFNRLTTNNIVGIAPSYDVDKILIRHNLILHCTRIFRIDGLRSEFVIINDLLYGILYLNRNILKREVSPIISRQRQCQIISEAFYNDVWNWLHNEGSILIIKYLSYLKEACKMTFHQCTIENHNIHGRIFVPVDQNHDIGNAIYYICKSSGQTIKAIFITDHAYISHVHNKLSLQTNTVNTTILLYKILISEYIKQADNLQFHQHLLKLSKWQEIYECYKAVMKLKPDLSSIGLIAYCRCLIMVCKYTEAEEILLNLMYTINEKDKAWTLLATARRKRKRYPAEESHRRLYEEYILANQSIEEACRANPPTEEALKEQQIIKKLTTAISLETLSPEHRSRADNCVYNILSIDGGGIRGIMAAIWLRELEYRTRRTCSSMFQMMAGTSTGAIIAAGLSIPDQNQRTRPADFASDLVLMYEAEGENIFVRKDRHWLDPLNLDPLATKYSSQEKKTLFEWYFRNTCICDCLTDIVIPSVRTGDICTHLFTRNNSLYSTRLVDVLMATTAAPTYFDPYFLNDRYYIDGGVQMNNPTMAAYTKAIEYGYDKENIYVLSLGTGDYLLDPLIDHTERRTTFYFEHYEHVLKVLFDSQQHNVDYQMSNLMNGRNYYRWQVWFEKSIELDNCDEQTVNTLENIAYEYWEEMEVCDDNRLNNWIQRLRDE